MSIREDLIQAYREKQKEKREQEARRIEKEKNEEKEDGLKLFRKIFGREPDKIEIEDDVGYYSILFFIEDIELLFVPHDKNGGWDGSFRVAGTCPRCNQKAYHRSYAESLEDLQYHLAEWDSGHSYGCQNYDENGNEIKSKYVPPASITVYKDSPQYQLLTSIEDFINYVGGQNE